MSDVLFLKPTCTFIEAVPYYKCRGPSMLCISHLESFHNNCISIIKIFLKQSLEYQIIFIFCYKKDIAAFFFSLKYIVGAKHSTPKRNIRKCLLERCLYTVMQAYLFAVKMFSLWQKCHWQLQVIYINIYNISWRVNSRKEGTQNQQWEAKVFII